MKFGDLIQFEQIESVIQLLDAAKPAEAKKLVSTYVISDDMAKRISDLMVPQLSFDASVDHKGVLIVGNYGTGKSHLMSVLSLVAEDAAYAPMIRHPKVADAVTSIAGRFKVLRLEVGGLEMPLRQIITQQLERFLEKLGISYAFPPAAQELNNKASFEEMMAAFNEKFPAQGVLLVIDEFLEYLQSRRDHELVLDLAFLRILGEVTKNDRFRFVAGVQEAIFDSGRFAHVADSMRRVNANPDRSPGRQFCRLRALAEKKCRPTKQDPRIPHAVRQVLWFHERTDGRVRASFSSASRLPENL
jgi:predicted ATPase